MKRSNFREWTLDALDLTFGLRQIRTSQVLDAWLASEHTVKDEIFDIFRIMHGLKQIIRRQVPN